MVSMLSRNYTAEVGVLGKKKTDLQTHGVLVSPELQDELEREWNAPAIKNGRFVFCLESPEDGSLTTVLIINGKFSERSPFSLASAIAFDASCLPFPFNSSSSCFNFSKPSGVINVNSMILTVFKLE